MGRKTLLKTISPYYIIIIVAAIATIAIYSTNRFRNFYLDRLAQELESRANLVSVHLDSLVRDRNHAAIDSLCKRVGQLTSTRLTVIALDGAVLGDSDEDPGNMENHGSRPEVVQALSSGHGRQTRHSNTLQTEMMYVAIPLRTDGKTLGTVRTSLPVAEIEQTLSNVNQNITVIGIIVIVLVIILGFLVFRRVTRDLSTIRAGAVRFARGDFDERLPVSDVAEVGDLAAAMNQMARQLGQRFRTIVEQRNTLDTVVGGMTDGLIAVDSAERIIDVNPSACQMFALDRNHAKEKAIQEVFRSIELLDFISRTLESNMPVTGRLVLRKTKEMHLQAHGSPLISADGGRLGGVIVLTDLTPIYKLENIRREFVSNVSHELKTPITSIKGFVETVLDSEQALSDESRRFLDKAAKQVSRLHVIIEDLLALSRLEQGEETAQSRFKLVSLRPILSSAIEHLDQKRADKGLNITLECDAQCRVTANPTLIEQAVSNLVDNAIRFSENDSEITVRCYDDREQTIIEVDDQGIGIEPGHIPRLFERFYRVDKARSREAGGSGLGLALVKHIALVHNGAVDVESEPGQGSIFRLLLPRVPVS